MKRIFTLLSLAFIMTWNATGQLVITAVYDADLPGGLPKGIELYALEDIADLSVFAVGSANNGDGSDGEEFVLSGSATKGDYIYVTSDSLPFNDFFGFDADFYADAMLINGDDAVELFLNGGVVDIFGDINMDGTGQPWEYTDGWAARKSETGPDGNAFMIDNWEFSGVGALDGEQTNATATVPVPIMSYGDTSQGGGPDATVITMNLQFIPRDITIEVGQTVRWTNPEVNVAHNVNANQDIYPCNPAGFFSGIAEKGVWDFDFTFSKPGLYDYQCDPHTGVDMFGTVTVVDPNAPDYAAVEIGVMRSVGLDGVADSLGRDCTLTGTVYGRNSRPGGLQFTIIDDNRDGLAVFSSSNTCYNVEEGDLISVAGSIDQFNGLTQIEPELKIEVLSKANPLLSPELIQGELGEETESRFVVVQDITVDSIVQTGGSGWNVFCSNQNADYLVRLDGDLFDDPVVSVGNILNVAGLGGQFDSSLPYTDGYQLLPQYEEDIEITNSVDFLGSDQIDLFPNPTSDIVNFKSDLNIQQILIYDQMGSIVRSSVRTIVDVSGMAVGLYNVTVQTTDGIWVGRFVKTD